jgi:hypothetical protein
MSLETLPRPEVQSVNAETDPVSPALTAEELAQAEALISSETPQKPASEFQLTAAMDATAYSAYLRIKHFVRDAHTLGDMANEVLETLEEKGFGQHVGRILQANGVIRPEGAKTDLAKMFASEPERLSKILALALADLAELGQSKSLQALLNSHGIITSSTGYELP